MGSGGVAAEKAATSMISLVKPGAGTRPFVVSMPFRTPNEQIGAKSLK
jgi:hypothetical protein